MRKNTAGNIIPYVVDFLIFVPLIFGFAFGLLVLRAKTAFGVLPYLSANDPWMLVNRAPRDALSDWFSYAAHINLIYLLLPFTALSTFLLPFLTLQMARQKMKLNSKFQYFLMGLALTSFLLLFQKGQFIFWLFD